MPRKKSSKSKKDLQTEELVDKLFEFIVIEIKEGRGENEIVGKVMDKFNLSQREAKKYHKLVKEKLLKSKEKVKEKQILFYEPQLQKENVIIAILLTVLSFSWYIPAWLWRQREAINNLESKTKVQSNIFLVLLILFFVSVFLVFVYPEEVFISIVSRIYGFIFAVIILIISFRVRRIFIDHFCKHLGLDVNFSGILTFFFTIFYLQYKINRISEGKYKKR